MDQKSLAQIVKMEALAEAWASIDGKMEKFLACKADPTLDQTEGYYVGYMAEAAELEKRLLTRGYVIRPKG